MSAQHINPSFLPINHDCRITDEVIDLCELQEEQNAQSSANYDVELLHPAVCTVILSDSSRVSTVCMCVLGRAGGGGGGG